MPDNEALAAALQYCREGFSVIPIQPSRKAPLVPWVDYMGRRAQEGEIRGWWTTWPNASVGIITGRISNCVVIDVERDGDAEAIWRDCPTQYVSRTGSGGHHLWYRYPAGVDNVPNAVRFMPSTDIRADGGLVVVPPSPHSSGGRYSWLTRGEMGDLTPKMLGLMLSGGNRDSGPSGEKWLADLLAGVDEGGRNDACARISGYFAGKGVPKDVTLTILGQWDQRNTPPLGSAVIERTVHSTYRTAYRRGGVGPTGDTQQPQQQGGSGLFNVVSLQDYMATHGGVTVTWTVDEWLPDETIAFVVAPPESYKTWFLLDMAASVATGTPFLGTYKVNNPGPVMLIQQEDFHGSVAERLGLILDSKLKVVQEDRDGEFAMRVPPEIPIYVHPDRNLRFADGAVMGMLEQRIQEIRPRIVILDPLYSAADSDDYMAKAAGQMFVLKRLRDTYHCTFIIAHHTNKGGGADFNRTGLWGSQFLNAFLETGWQIRRPTDVPEAVVVRRHFKVTGGTPDVRVDFTIHSEGYPFQYRPQVRDATGEESGLDTAAKIVTFLEENPGPRAINDIADELGVHRSTISRKLKALERDNMVRRSGDGKYTLSNPPPHM